MFKTLIAGIILGIGASGAALHYVPLVDQYRERSIIDVAPNGGNTEFFHINVPLDRIMIGAPYEDVPVPPGLEWPTDERLASVRTELFKIRNAHDAVVGVASRVAAADQSTGNIIEWVLHLPARGSVYVTMPPDAVDSGLRVGALNKGTRGFRNLQGQLSERWVAIDDPGEDPEAGRIELEITSVAREEADAS